MSKLYFYYATMSAGKTTILLQHAYNNNEKNIYTLLFIPETANKNGIISSRIGISKKALIITSTMNLFLYVRNLKTKPKLILIDEAQFLLKKHVFELISIVDIFKIMVFTYGLRTDFKGKLFIGSQYLLALADKIIEIKSICKCHKKAIMNARIINNKRVISGNQIDIDKKKYTQLCRYHYYNFNK